MGQPFLNVAVLMPGLILGLGESMKSVKDFTDNSLSEIIALTGKTAVVTGGGRGLGKAIAVRLAEAGANILIGDIDADLAAEAAADISKRYAPEALGTLMDVTDSDSVNAAAELAVDQFGSIDIWVNNAGIFPCVELKDMTDELWDSVLAVNTRGTFAGARAAAAAMRNNEAGGVVVNVVSTAGFRGVAPGLAAYVSSKHAVRGMTRQLALELAPEAIRVLGVAPTFCVTEGNLLAMQQDPQNPEAIEQITSMVSSKLGRVGVPDDVARVVLFCASDMAAFMTGSTLKVDAGENI